MAKRLYRFGDDYLLAYGRKIMRITWINSGKNVELRVIPRKHRDAQQWAYHPKAD